MGKPAAVVQALNGYANRILSECVGENEVPAEILIRARDTKTVAEAEQVGKDLLDQVEGLADPPYRHGGKFYDKDLKALAKKIGWKP